MKSSTMPKYEQQKNECMNLLSNRRKNDCDVESWGDWLKRDEKGKERSWCLGFEGDDSRGAAHPRARLVCVPGLETSAAVRYTNHGARRHMLDMLEEWGCGVAAWVLWASRTSTA